MPKEEFAMLAHVYNPMIRYVGHMMSRKLNGWGCIWDGGITRGMPAKEVPWYYEGGDYRLQSVPIATGLWTIGRADKDGIRPKVINAPDWFLNALPREIPLQGELWHETDDISYVKSICGRGISGTTDPRWEEIIFKIYNVKPYSKWQGIEKIIPCHNCSLITDVFWQSRIWSVRMENAKSRTTENNNLEFLKQTKVESEESLHAHIRVAKELGWEGLMLVNPISYYQCARSYDLVKVKPLFETEGRVVGYEDGKTGKNIGRLGSAICEVKWDEKVLSVTGGKERFVGKIVRFGVSGWDDDEREWSSITKQYPLGSTLHFSFLGVSTHGVPTSCNRIKEEK